MVDDEERVGFERDASEVARWDQVEIHGSKLARGLKMAQEDKTIVLCLSSTRFHSSRRNTTFQNNQAG